jgi:TRAP-type uncharacterized transport system substrate-binding protein
MIITCQRKNEKEEAWKLGNDGIPLHPGAEKYYRDKMRG